MNSIVCDKFLRYVQIDTQSLEEQSDKVPSTDKQRNLAKLLCQELADMGIVDVRYDEEHCYVYASIPANIEGKPAVGFIAHMDTADAVSGENVKPRLIENYDGKDIVLNSELNVVTTVKEFPMLKDCVGKTLIVTDGTTLLGGDDKAGVAEIMTMAEYFMKNPEVKHGKICIGFTPDEEVGNGVEYFDIKAFGADFAYTVDGGMLGDMSYECFHAAGAKIVVHGKSTHPGYSKNIMINAVKLAMEFNSMIPEEECPECTEGYEGFYHITDFKGACEEATISYIIRDHDREKFEKRKEFILDVVAKMNKKYGDNTFEIMIKDQYHNMREMIEPQIHIVDNVKEAMKKVGITPVVSPIRGGTDGARLSYDGLLCPNLCTGSEGHHGKNEFACVDDMEKIVEVLKELIQICAK